MDRRLVQRPVSSSSEHGGTRLKSIVVILIVAIVVGQPSGETQHREGAVYPANSISRLLDTGEGGRKEGRVVYPHFLWPFYLQLPV